MAFTNPKPVLFDDNEITIANNHAEDSQESPTYEEHDNVYFAFIDVLGFSKTFEDNKENPDGKFASKYRKTFQYYAQLMSALEKVSSQNLLSAGQTSDSLYFYTDRPDFLIRFMKLFSHFNMYAMSQDVFFRGGISKGKLFIEQPHHFYGDCVIQSYLLENKIAKLPIVMIDQSTYDELSSIEDLSQLIDSNTDKTRFFIKPFANISIAEIVELLPDLENILKVLTKKDWEQIGCYIREGKTQFEFDDSNYSKYCFLKKEYDQACELLSNLA